MIAPLHTAVADSSISTTVLFCWCAYAQASSKPNLAEIEKWNSWLVSFKDEEEDPVIRAWAQRLKVYGFVHVDDLDLTIARIVECGYLEGTGFAEQAQKLDESSRANEKAGRFSAVWRRFHDSFSSDQAEFITELHAAAAEAVNTMGSGDLSSTVSLLRQLEREDLADELIERYVAAHASNPSTFDLKEHPFGGSIGDEKLRERFEEMHARLTQLPSLHAAVSFVAQNSGYNDEHIEAMKRASVDEYEALFLADHSAPKLPSLIKWTLRWSGTDHAEITDKAREALKRIKETSLLNAIRAGRYGV